MKTYSVNNNVGKAKHIVSFHDGKKKHADNSPFFDIAIFSNKKKAVSFERELMAKGYTK